MAERIIRTGVGTYMGADAAWRFGMQGETVDVHEDDLERFDRLNPAEPEVEADEDDDLDGDEQGDEESAAPLSKMKKDELIAHAGEHGIDISGASTKPEILAAIEAAVKAAAESTGEQPDGTESTDGESAGDSGGQSAGDGSSQE